MIATTLRFLAGQFAVGGEGERTGPMDVDLSVKLKEQAH